MAWGPLGRFGANRTANRLLREGRAQYDASELGAAEPLLRGAVEAAQRGGNAVLLAAAAEQYATLLLRMKRYVEAVAVLEAWVSAQKRATGENGDEVRSARNQLTWIYGKLERFGDAERVSRDRLASARRRHGDTGRETGFALVTLGWAVLNQGRVEEAESVYREALALLENVAGSSDGANGWALLGLAAIAVQRGDVGQAESELTRAHDNWDRVGRADMAERTRERLMDLYLEHGEFVKAAAMADAAMRRLTRRGWRDDRRKARNLERSAKALRGVGREDEARRHETRAAYLRSAIEKERVETAESWQRHAASQTETPGEIFEGDDEWPLATPVFIARN